MDENRRQEAIEELTQVRRDTQTLICGMIPEEWAEHVYDRLAALWEFPEEAESMLTELFETAKAPWVNSAWLRAWGQKFKRLWHGQEAPMEPEPLIDHRLFKGVKGGCPRCKGSGRISWEFPKHDPEGSIDCPDCRGTGERRKGEQRKDAGRRDYDRANHPNAIDGCAPQYETLKGKTLDRRISEERRK